VLNVSKYVIKKIIDNKIKKMAKDIELENSGYEENKE